jgi:hypothetical protein
MTTPTPAQADEKIERIAAILMSRVNAPEGEIYSVARDIVAALRPGGEAVALGAIEHDPHDHSREYIPLPGGWEVQTKGAGSSYRLLDKKTGERHAILSGKDWQGLQAFFSRFARELFQACRATPPAPAGVKELRDAISGALDDMGADGLSVCGLAKAHLRFALGPMTDDPDAPDYSFEAARSVIIECDEMHGKRSPLRSSLLPPGPEAQASAPAEALPAGADAVTQIAFGHFKTTTERAQRIAVLEAALEPFALISSEGVIGSRETTGDVEIVTQAEYFHRAADALAQSLSSAPAQAAPAQAREERDDG